MTESGGTVDVVHVDDDQHVRELTATYLEREDERITVHTAATAEEGRTLLDRIDPDCVISDYEMSETDGIEFLRTVRESHPDLPFILFTGKGNESVASEAIAAGVTDYLQKGSGGDQYAVLANRLMNAVEASRSRAALAERNRDLRRYKRMINAMQEAAWIYDAEGQFEVVNESLAAWYDTTREALEGTEGNLLALIREESEAERPFRELLDGERERLHGRIESNFPGHGHAVIDYRLYPLTDGEERKAVGVARDVTEAQHREERLRRYKTILETIDDAAFVVDETRRVSYANPAAMENVSLSPGEVLGEPIEALVDRYAATTEETERFVQTLNSAFAEPSPDEPTEVTLTLSVQGTEVTFEYRFAPIVEGGTASAVVVTGRDVTERKERERRLNEQNERLEEFASVVSHDLRNPLHVAATHLELAREESDSDHIGDALDAIERSQALVDDLLTLAREGDQLDELESVDLQEIADECWCAVETDAERLETGELPSVRADPGRLRQLFENLFRNAVEHGGSGVAVTVGRLPDGFYVEDDGVGVPEDKTEQIFEPGFSTDPDGTGFGLRIVQEIANAHGWSVTVTDGTDGGARFEIRGVEPLVRQ
ncbi:response regulator [Halovenus sp. WSH3]|uniref:histidine kinase n=1 Tax=Halovenus carboxidivorans TaxID=2692199 RepID=A0A6B0TCT3_9EURY|nr:response regulator [Halovenus carboxidivorans]MXR53041.1 response regulator [Halovenus carboxidivorans]